MTNSNSGSLGVLPLRIVLMLAAVSTCPAVHAKDEKDDQPTDLIYEEVLVTGGALEIRTLSGSAALLDKSQILKFDSIDVNGLLTQIPGVYLRLEDGYGLRPNIGIRGATSERSQKITLMEDGILIAPAPYSAPAAYYMPNVNRMSSIEVFKGPSAIKHGPHTVGGAINMVTPSTPNFAQGLLEATLGTDNFQKYHAVYGETIGQWGYSVDALRFGSDGFKELDGGGSTGFSRNDINAKLQWFGDEAADIYQQVQLKVGYADEDSDETYLGLTDADFLAKPERRYVASSLDKFESEHVQLHLIHLIDFGNDWKLTSKLYYNKFDRDWTKFDGFIDRTAAPPSFVLASPERYAGEIALFRGEIDSNGSESETINVTDFDREYGSSGVDFGLKYAFGFKNVSHNLEFGLRYHYDYVERNHTPVGYLVQSADLVFDGRSRAAITSNKDETDAIAVFISDSISYQNWTFDLGVRYEYIEGVRHNHLAGLIGDSKQDIVLPGLGLFYEINQHWGVLAGINKGFSPASPSAGEGVNPEESVSYEYGLRYTKDDTRIDLVGFFSDYKNLLGRCRVSDVGCEEGEEFNGGDVEIAGAELTANYTARLGYQLLFPISLVYTFTETAFQSSFTSKFSQWNPGYFDGVQRSVRKGDELPYTPEHQARLQLGITSMNWSADLAIKYAGEMREVPGRGGNIEGQYTKALMTADLAFAYSVTDNFEIKIIAENVTDEQEVVSRRPFGARPNLPRTFKIGGSLKF